VPRTNISAVSHELRTPLTSSKEAGSALNGRLGEMDDRFRSPLEIAQRKRCAPVRLVDNHTIVPKNRRATPHYRLISSGRSGRPFKDSFEEKQMFAAEQRSARRPQRGDQSAIITGDAFWQSGK